MRRNWTEGLASTGAQYISLQYEEIVSDMDRQMARLFHFLGLRLDFIVRPRMRVSMRTVAGATPKETTEMSVDRGYLNASMIREAVERRLPELRGKVMASRSARPSPTYVPDPNSVLMTLDLRNS